MTEKDLNLSIDSSLLASSADHRPTQNATQPAASLKENMNPQGTPGDTKTESRLPLAILVGAIAVNLFFLTWAGLWLQKNVPASPDNPPAELSGAYSPAVIDGIERQLTELSQQLNHLSLRLAEQKLLFAAGHHELSDKLDSYAETVATLSSPATDTLQKPAAAISAALAPAKPANQKPQGKQWFVNLGTFSTRTSAKGLQQQIGNMGYPATLREIAIDGKTAYRVQIPGFESRQTAEKTAQEIMSRTKLSGLWAWKED